jgi:predicted kinase
MVGIPGSGKSCFIRNNKKDDDFVISSDAIREELFGDAGCQDDNGKVFQIVYKRMVEALKFGRDVWLDATNINRKCRRVMFEKLKQAKLNPTVYAVVMGTRFEECVRRDAERDRTVGEEVIWKFVRRFEYPHKFEGFDKVSHQTDVGDYIEKVREDLLKMVGFDQKNPWHKLDLWKHTQRVIEQVPEEMKLAAFCHDIGKLFTQVICDGVGHYYRHENVSAYYFACYWVELVHISGFAGDFDQTMFLVNYHMVGHQATEESGRKLFGDLYDELKVFCRADSLAKE